MNMNTSVALSNLSDLCAGIVVVNTSTFTVTQTNEADTCLIAFTVPCTRLSAVAIEE